MMFETENEHRNSTPDILLSESDERFIESLKEFIKHEKCYVTYHLKDPDEEKYTTYTTYRYVFNKVIERSVAYKGLLLTIKAEYDDIIWEMQRREEEVRMAQRTLTTSTSTAKSLRTCQSRITNLQERISVLQRETAALQQEISRQRLWKEQTMWIPGVTVVQSENPEALDKHLVQLEAQRATLVDKRRHCVSMEVKDKLDAKLQAAQLHRDHLHIETSRRRLLYKRLRCVSDSLCSWEDGGRQVPLEELLASILQRVSETRVIDEDVCKIDAEVFENEEPTGRHESKHLEDYLNRFVELFDSAQFEEAALLAAQSPRGVLRNLYTMDIFKGVKGAPLSRPPLLLFFRALLMTSPAGDKLSTCVSVQGVHCALEHGASQLVIHAVIQNKVAFSEELGDILSEHAHRMSAEADMFLTLSTVVYKACGLHRKTALSMCRRGLIDSATEFMTHCKGFTADDYMWVLCHSPSLCLLQKMVQPHRDQEAILSVGVVCSVMLADSQHQQLALELLDDLRNRELLDKAIREDHGSSVEIWAKVAYLCSGMKRADLSQSIMSVLLSQSGNRVLSPDMEGAQLMEHIFL